jgi:hypothetical protein
MGEESGGKTSCKIWRRRIIGDEEGGKFKFMFPGTWIFPKPSFHKN